MNDGGVVVDLSNAGLTAADFGDNALARTNGFVNSYGGTPLSDVTFYDNTVALAGGVVGQGA